MVHGIYLSKLLSPWKEESYLKHKTILRDNVRLQRTWTGQRNTLVWFCKFLCQSLQNMTLEPLRRGLHRPGGWGGGGEQREKYRSAASDGPGRMSPAAKGRRGEQELWSALIRGNKVERPAHPAKVHPSPSTPQMMYEQVCVLRTQLHSPQHCNPVRTKQRSGKELNHTPALRFWTRI